MTLQELKSTIESKNIPTGLTVLKVADSDFIPNQYIDFIRKHTDFQVNSVDSLKEVINIKADIFSFISAKKSIYIYRTDEFNCQTQDVLNSNVIVVCKKIEKKTKEMFSDYIIDVPKLELWQLEDYAYSIADGVDKKKLKNIVDSCNGNIYRLDNELQKLSIFDKSRRQFIYDSMLEDGNFRDMNNYTIFNFTNAIVRKDVKTLFNLYKDIQYVDVEPIAFPIILIKAFKNVIDVQLSNLSADQLNMKSNQYWAIKNFSCGFYTKDQLMYIYGFLNDLDRRIKIGIMPMEHIVDYIVIKILGI